MRMRLSLCSLAVVLLLAWLALTSVGVGAANRFVLQVPATYLSVGQQIEPRLVSLAPSAATPAAEVTVELLNAAGRKLSAEQIRLDGAATASVMPLSLPRAGVYMLRATSAKGEQQIRLHALPDAAQGLGGVLPITALGVPAGVADYLRQHSFVVQPASLSEAAPAASRLILVAAPGFGGGNVGDSYRWLWQQADQGAQVLLLEPPVPAMAAYWPLAPPLGPPPAAESCGEDVFAPPLSNGLGVDAGLQALLRPSLTFDLTHESAVDLYRWNGHLLLAAKRAAGAGGGYRGCHTLITYRYGAGWVTASTLPLLEHFQDMRARRLLMNLIAAVSRRKPHAPPGNGLAWVTAKRLKTLAPRMGPWDAVYYRAAPQAVESAPELVPAASDGDPRSCWAVPAAGERGASLTLALGQARAVRALVLEASAVPAFQLTASHDGVHWQALGKPTAAASAAPPLTVAVPAGAWRQFRLMLTAPAASWRLCQLSAN